MQQISKNILGREFEALDLDFLQTFFGSPRKETQHLEFKSGKVLVGDLFKEICAFLNNKGGMLIIGSPEEIKTPDDQRICHGDLTPTMFPDKKWLKTQFYNNIIPQTFQLKIAEFNYRNGKIYVLEIPESAEAPHQVFGEGRYYIRKQTQAVPAPHQVVKNMFLQQEKPVIAAEIGIRKIKQKPAPFNLLLIDIFNKARKGTERIYYTLHIYNLEDIQHLDANHQVQINEHHQHFIIEESIDKPLVKGIQLKRNFEVLAHKPYYLSLQLWEQQGSLFEYRLLFDPVNFKPLLEYHSNDRKVIQEDQFFNALEEINRRVF